MLGDVLSPEDAVDDFIQTNAVAAGFGRATAPMRYGKR